MDLLAAPIGTLLPGSLALDSLPIGPLMLPFAAERGLSI